MSKRRAGMRKAGSDMNWFKTWAKPESSCVAKPILSESVCCVHLANSVHVLNVVSREKCKSKY